MIEFPNLYYSNIDEPKLKELLQAKNAPKIKWRNKFTSFSGRNIVGKVCRIVYKFFRGLFVCVIFYVAPMSVVLYGHARLYLASQYINDNYSV